LQESMACPAREGIAQALRELGIEGWRIGIFD
jgi:hypothetical protein